jgi:hypothetical protein
MELQQKLPIPDARHIALRLAGLFYVALSHCVTMKQDGDRLEADADMVKFAGFVGESAASALHTLIAALKSGRSFEEHGFDEERIADEIRSHFLDRLRTGHTKDCKDCQGQIGHIAQMLCISHQMASDVMEQAEGEQAAAPSAPAESTVH